MNENDIIKALECCVNDKCIECPLRNKPKLKGCLKLQYYALGLICRQKSVIQGFEVDYKRVCTERDARIFTAEFCKRETIKEFAERIETELANNTDISAVGYQSVIAIIDGLVKEMTEVPHAEID